MYRNQQVSTWSLSFCYFKKLFTKKTVYSYSYYYSILFQHGEASHLMHRLRAKAEVKAIGKALLPDN